MTANSTRTTKNKIGLSSLCLYSTGGVDIADVKASSQIRVHEGATEGRFEGGRIQLLAGHVPSRISPPMEDGAPPFSGLVVLHGPDMLNEGRYWALEAHRRGMSIAMVHFEVDVGQITSAVHDMDSLTKRRDRYFSLRRSSREVQDYVLDQVINRMSERGEALLLPDVPRVSLMALRPDLLVDWMLNDPLVSHVDVGIFPLADDPKKPFALRQLAFVRTGAKVVGQLQGQPDVDLGVPRWLSDRAMAQQFATEARAEEKPRAKRSGRP